MADAILQSFMDAFLTSENEAAARAALSAQNETAPKVVYVKTDGNDSTGEIGNPARPFVTAQAAADAIAAAPSGGSYAIRLGVGSFGGIVFTATLAERIRSIFGEGPTLSSLGGITANGSTGADGSGTIPDGEGEKHGFNLTLTSDGTVNLGDIYVNGGAGGNGGLSDDGEVGGNGGSGGNAGEIDLFQCRFGDLYANGGNGGSGMSGNSSYGNGGNGGSIGSLLLRYCKFNSVNQSNGSGGTGDSEGSVGAETGNLQVLFCEYGSINNPEAQSSTSGTIIAYSVYSGTQGNAQIVDTVSSTPV